MRLEVGSSTSGRLQSLEGFLSVKQVWHKTKSKLVPVCNTTHQSFSKDISDCPQVLQEHVKYF